MESRPRLVEVQASGRLANLITVSMPLLEGLFLATVLDGRAGRLRLSFDDSVAADVEAALTQWQRQFPGELQICADPTKPDA